MFNKIIIFSKVISIDLFVAFCFDANITVRQQLIPSYLGHLWPT